MKIKWLIIFLLCISSVEANSFRRDKTNTSSNPGWPMNVDASQWPVGVLKTQANADSINARHQYLISQRHAWTTNGDPLYINAIQALNPNFEWIEYNSFQDNYVTSEEHNWITSRLVAAGLNPENLYMHYWNATVVNLQGSVLSFVGLQNATTLADTINSRIPVYYSNRSRILVNHYNPATRNLTKQYACMRLTTLPTQGGYTSTRYIDGIFWDNVQPPFWNYGTVTSGGQVAEHPTHGLITDFSINRSGWWYYENIKPFFLELMDTLRTSASWTRDNDRKWVDINTAGVILNDMAVSKISDGFGHEFCYSPVRTYTSSIPIIYSWDSLCAVNGIDIVYGAPMITSSSGYLGSYTYPEAMYSDLCFFYLTSSDSAWLSPMGTPGAANFYWDSLTWCGAMDFNVGPHYLADKKYSIHQTGVDPRNYAYTIFTRNYPNAKVFLRTRGNYNQHIDEMTAINVDLLGSYRELYPNGTLGPVVTTTTFRNAQGKIFVPATGTIDSIPPGPVRDLR